VEAVGGVTRLDLGHLPADTRNTMRLLYRHLRHEQVWERDDPRLGVIVCTKPGVERTVARDRVALAVGLRRAA
jgi:hypothetical protein